MLLRRGNVDTDVRVYLLKTPRTSAKRYCYQPQFTMALKLREVKELALDQSATLEVRCTLHLLTTPKLPLNQTAPSAHSLPTQQPQYDPRMALPTRCPLSEATMPSPQPWALGRRIRELRVSIMYSPEIFSFLFFPL